MDLVQTIRKEGSRGGRGEFKWDDVRSSSHRENYLGHSLMAPVGRWQKNKDLSWYARGEDGSQLSQADARKEELRRVKLAEEEAMAKALGIELPDGNANMTAIGSRDGRSRAIGTGEGEGETKDGDARASETGGDTGRGRDPEPGPSPGPGPGQGAARGAETSQDRGGETENVERMEKRGASIVIAGRIVTI